MRKPSITQRLVFALARCVGVARCEAVGERLRMNVAQLGKHTTDFEHYSGQRRHIVFRSVGSTGMHRLQVDVAPEPSDVFWPNLELSKRDRISWNVANGNPNPSPNPNPNPNSNPNPDPDPDPDPDPNPNRDPNPDPLLLPLYLTLTLTLSLALTLTLGAILVVCGLTSAAALVATTFFAEAYKQERAGYLST